MKRLINENALNPFFTCVQVLKRENVDYIVAPYEADSQMAFLSVNNIVDAVITEDSDLIPFGCPRVCNVSQYPYLKSLLYFLYIKLGSCASDYF